MNQPLTPENVRQANAVVAFVLTVIVFKYKLHAARWMHYPPHMGSPLKWGLKHAILLLLLCFHIFFWANWFVSALARGAALVGLFVAKLPWTNAAKRGWSTASKAKKRSPRF